MKSENERVVVHEMRGFVADDLQGAFQESYAVSRGTRCKQHLFSLSLNPPKEADVSAREFEDAITRAEKRLGLDGQPRAIVFHEKRGVDGELRKHAHAVWCRIDTDTMKAVQLSHTHRKLRDVSRELYLKHDWSMPDGLRDSKQRDIRNITLAEWQQAKRSGHNPKHIKAMFQDSWSASDGRAAFGAALLEKGYVLAQGKRGHVAVDHTGEVYPVSRWVGLRTKDVRARLGDIENLPSVEAAQKQASRLIADRLQELKAEQTSAARSAFTKAAKERERLHAERIRAEAALRQSQAERQATEQAEREARIRRGVMGLIDRLTGRRNRLLAENRKDVQLKALRDKREREAQERKHSTALRDLRQQKRESIRPHVKAAHELREDIRALRGVQPKPQKPLRTRRRTRARSRDGPEPGF
ncbi:relaxase/mobilization nuclease domain-containing protein [Labrenzia sp. THAF82]|uniref:relaxase/mobilization nuclease domain-containing protein n=1 Tax=Labrenzia sp. THAF82 TaxID=2587861 RepID=UPI00126924DA|nr:relaxase [Labrenzia sp. THAF82]